MVENNQVIYIYYQCSLLMEKNPAQQPMWVSLHKSSVAQQLYAGQSMSEKSEEITTGYATVRTRRGSVPTDNSKACYIKVSSLFTLHQAGVMLVTGNSCKIAPHRVLEQRHSTGPGSLCAHTQTKEKKVSTSSPTSQKSLAML